MEVNINTISEVLHEAEIRLTNEELQPHFEQAYKEQRATVELRGFRKGKAPMAMIKSLYGEAVEHGALDSVASEFYRKAMVEQNIHPIGQPTMTDMDFKRGEAFRFKIKYEVRPNIKLNKYKGIAVEKPIHTVTEDDVEDEIGHLRKINSSTSNVDSVTDESHIVTADVQELDDAGTPLVGRKTPNAKFDLSDRSLLQEIKDVLRNANVGESYRARFESKRGSHTHNNHIAITVNKIEKVTLPPFDESLVKKITNNKVLTTEEFVRATRSNLEQYWKDQSARKLYDAITAEVVKNHNFTVPETLVNGILDTLIDDIKNKSKDRALPKEFDEQQFRNDSRALAIWQAKWILLKERIAEAENITVTDEEIEKLAETEGTRSGIEKNRLLEYFKNSSAATERLLTEKIMTFLKSNAKITEKAVEERALA